MLKSVHFTTRSYVPEMPAVIEEHSVTLGTDVLIYLTYCIYSASLASIINPVSLGDGNWISTVTLDPTRNSITVKSGDVELTTIPENPAIAPLFLESCKKGLMVPDSMVFLPTKNISMELIKTHSFVIELQLEFAAIEDALSEIEEGQ